MKALRIKEKKRMGYQVKVPRHGTKHYNTFVYLIANIAGFEAPKVQRIDEANIRISECCNEISKSIYIMGRSS